MSLRLFDDRIPLNFSYSDFVIFFVVAMFLQLWDGIITTIMIGNGCVKEMNPLMIPLVENGSFFSFKIVSVLYFGVASWTLYKFFPKTTVLSVWFVILIYIIVTAWNCLVLY
jgi:hypothetical protein